LIAGVRPTRAPTCANLTRKRRSSVEGTTIETAPTPNLCLACGTVLSPALARSASLRCHDCRDAQAPLRRELVEPAAQPAKLRRRLRLRPAA